ncbi:hypothetical protein VTJ83DRAFT_4295 [Remersonia thermophila]|uniref:RNA polymerase II subunit B1 CTD phosphatase RPAP2 homolog n=1 Tax=Remersonia thermophila TaxID=72144 RepID=A0ABR4D9K4_9PEZI
MASPSPTTHPKPQQPQPRGILKKPKAAPPTQTQPRPPQATAAATTTPAGSQPSLTRAELLQQQELAARQRLLQKLRDSDLVKPPVPLETFELLSRFPRAADRPASSPAADDAADLLRALAGFQPSEYLDLIEERNCLGRCGYALCPRPRRRHEGAWKLRSSAASAVVARTADLNKWCSDACAVRAMHLKVQLDNPSYVRVEEEEEEENEEAQEAGGKKVVRRVRKSKLVVKLELREESTIRGGSQEPAAAAAARTAAPKTAAHHQPRGTQEDRDKLASELARLSIDDKKKRDAAELARERGDPGGPLAGVVTRVDVTISDKDVDGPAEAPSLDLVGTEGMIEGYKPRSGTGKAKDGKAKRSKDRDADDDDDDDDDDNDDDDDGDDYDVFDDPMKGASLRC